MKTLITLIAITCPVGAVLARQPSAPPEPAPEPRNWEVWVGDWTMAGTAKDSPTEPEYKVDWRLQAH